MLHVHDIAVVPVSGDLNVRTVPALRRTLEDLMQDGCHRVILNMSDVPYVDSAGMALIVCTVREMHSRGDLLSLTNVCPNVFRALKVSRLVDVIPVSEAGAHREVPELDPATLPLWRTTLRVDGEDLQAARMRIEELADRMLSHDAVFDLTLAAGEALGNAADHTCGDGILATVSAYPDRMVVEVTDCGCGFVPDEKRIASVSAQDERGRGIRLMRLLVDSVTIEARPAGVGTVVRLVKLVG